MAIKLIVIGPTKETFYKESANEYLKRLTKYCKLNYIQIPASRKSVIREECLAMESSSIKKHIGPSDFVFYWMRKEIIIAVDNLQKSSI